MSKAGKCIQGCPYQRVAILARDLSQKACSTGIMLPTSIIQRIRGITDLMVHRLPSPKAICSLAGGAYAGAKKVFDKLAEPENGSTSVGGLHKRCKRGRH